MRWKYAKRHLLFFLREKKTFIIDDGITYDVISYILV